MNQLLRMKSLRRLVVFSQDDGDIDSPQGVQFDLHGASPQNPGYSFRRGRMAPAYDDTGRIGVIGAVG